MIDNQQRYLQIAFNKDLSEVYRILPRIPKSNRIIIEAGTPFLKREGMRGLNTIAGMWGGNVIADMKVTDGAIQEVDMARSAGATGITVMSTAPAETLNFFVKRCEELNMLSMLDLLGNDDPLKVMRKIKHMEPDVVIIHKGRDEETTKGKLIQYKLVNKIRSKYSSVISAAGGVDLKEARSAIFNGATIVVVNIVSNTDAWTGITSEGNVSEVAQEFLDTIS